MCSNERDDPCRAKGDALKDVIATYEDLSPKSRASEGVPQGEISCARPPEERYDVCLNDERRRVPPNRANQLMSHGDELMRARPTARRLVICPNGRTAPCRASPARTSLGGRIF